MLGSLGATRTVSAHGVVTQLAHLSAKRGNDRFLLDTPVNMVVHHNHNDVVAAEQTACNMARRFDSQDSDCVAKDVVSVSTRTAEWPSSSAQVP